MFEVLYPPAACEELLTNRDIAPEKPMIKTKILHMATKFADDTADFTLARAHARAWEE